MNEATIQFGARCHDYPRQEPETLFAAIAADGFSVCQLAIQKALPPEAQSLPRIAAALEKARLGVAVLGCYVELGMAEETARAAAVARFRAGIDAAKTLSAGCIGSETTNCAKQPGVSRKQALAALERSLGEILPEAEAAGVMVGIEPVFYHTMATPELTRQVLCDMQSPNLGVIFDAVNLIGPDDLPEEAQLAMWQRAGDAFGDRILAAHIKGLALDENGGITANPAPFEGSPVKLEPVFRLLRQVGFTGPALREGLVPAHAKADLAQMKRWARI